VQPVEEKVKAGAALAEDQEQEEFTEIKLATKYAGYLKINSLGKCFIHYSTHNISSKGEIASCKEIIPNVKFHGLI